MKYNGNEISKEALSKAMQCDTPEELVKLAKAEGFELTMQEADAYLSEIEDIDLDSAQLKKVAGGYGDPPPLHCKCPHHCNMAP